MRCISLFVLHDQTFLHRNMDVMRDLEKQQAKWSFYITQAKGFREYQSQFFCCGTKMQQSDIVDRLQVMGYEMGYIQRAIRLHQKKKFDTNYNLNILVEILILLHKKDAEKFESKLSECIGCGLRTEQYPFHCQHPHCSECCADIINKSLTLSNAIPHCLKCDNILNVSNIHKQINSLLLPKYQITDEYKLLYNDIDCLISGYIRTEIQQYIPKEIMASIFDFYKLMFCKKIVCSDCDAVGYLRKKKNNKLIHCRLCRNNGYIECETCNKTGRLSLWNQCNSCGGEGEITETYSVDGGPYYGNFTETRTETCWHCNGHGETKSVHSPLCDSCNGSGMKVCFTCKCRNCEGNKYLVYTHINKICRNQLLCYKCNNYFPQNMLLFLSNCHHTFCYKCCSQHIKTELSSYRIADCLQCKQGNFKIFGSEFNNDLNNKFTKVYNRWNKFVCVKCGDMHDNTLLFAWNNCGHKYGITCVKEYILHENPATKFPECMQKKCTQKLSNTDAKAWGFDYSYYKKHVMLRSMYALGWFILVVTILGIIVFGASLVIMRVEDKFQETKDYSQSFTIEGDCILIESHLYVTANNADPNNADLYTYHNVYTYQI
eukprot:377366_1